MRGIEMIKTSALLIGLAAALGGAPAEAGDSYRVRQIASSQDGDYQIVELAESAGRDGENLVTGMTLTATTRAGVTKTFLFEHDLRSEKTAGGFVTIMTPAAALRNADQGLPDFVIPAQFLPTDGATLTLAGVDSWTYDALPKGSGAALRDDVMNSTDLVLYTTGDYAIQHLDLTIDRVYEFYNAALDHYFITGSQPDIDALDSGRIPGWKRTGALAAFTAMSAACCGTSATAAPTGPAAVCRYYIPPGSHFISASRDECDAVGRDHPEFVLEASAAFFAWLPDATTGSCDSISTGTAVTATQPVYRLWNNRADTNHRYTTSLTTRDAMARAGWVSEGYGEKGVAMCVPVAP